MAKMRRRIKTLETLLKQILESPEGIDYRNRKSKEYQKEYRTKNKDKIVPARHVHHTGTSIPKTTNKTVL